ncbi:hypothetical protein BDB01DRAFT_258619 [Pilobolus umbonatus]|nr:hypothetical protein BDB01DRAFT_258619 [Pilobolus umbonatus]
MNSLEIQKVNSRSSSTSHRTREESPSSSTKSTGERESSSSSLKKKNSDSARLEEHILKQFEGRARLKNLKRTVEASKDKEGHITDKIALQVLQTEIRFLNFVSKERPPYSWENLKAKFKSYFTNMSPTKLNKWMEMIFISRDHHMEWLDHTIKRNGRAIISPEIEESIKAEILYGSDLNDIKDALSRLLDQEHHKKMKILEKEAHHLRETRAGLKDEIRGYQARIMQMDIEINEMDQSIKAITPNPDKQATICGILKSNYHLEREFEDIYRLFDAVDKKEWKDILRKRISKCFVEGEGTAKCKQTIYEILKKKMMDHMNQNYISASNSTGYIPHDHQNKLNPQDIRVQRSISSNTIGSSHSESNL